MNLNRWSKLLVHSAIPLPRLALLHRLWMKRVDVGRPEDGGVVAVVYKTVPGGDVDDLEGNKDYCEGPS